MKHWARKSKTLLIAFKILNNWQMRRRFAAGRIETEHGSSHSRKSLAESLAYIEEQYRDYLTYGQLSHEDVQGKRILELGFGDNVGVALKFLAAGAGQVVCVDKFYSKRDTAREREIYAGLRRGLPPDEQRRFDAVISMADDVKFDATKLQALNGLDLEAAAHQLKEQDQVFDLIISRAVIEEIYEPAGVLAAADGLLAPGGLMLHKIDLSDYGIFSDGGMHPLTFLTIPESVYRLMASDSGIPNRKLLGYYRKQMDGFSYDTKFFVTSIVGHGPVVPHREISALDEDGSEVALPVINEIRPKLWREFKRMSDEELMVQGVFLVGRKPTSAN